jgi:tRNA G18 (ribose-2'-O)-methylase SpoU
MVTGIEPPLLLAAIEQRKLELYSLAPGGSLDIAQCRFDRRCGLIVGSEGRGVSAPLRGKAMDVRIPTIAVESLNAATAAAIALYEARRQRMTAP